ncbi:Spermidine hydroxycinnamoyl transferase [Linum grandiflorum]
MVFVSITRSTMVKPARPTWTGRMSLSEWDMIGGMNHVNGIYFYMSPQNGIFFTASRLMDSLSRTLIHFYPLAGRLEPVGKGGRFELECNAEGVLFIEAVAETTSLKELGESGHGGTGTFMSGCGNSDFQPLIPKVDYTRPISEWPLMLVQLTEFNCGSLSLCFYLSHVAVDGTSVFHFLNEWARIARGEGIGTVPFLDRKVLRAGEPPLSRRPLRFDPVEFQRPPVLLPDDTNQNGGYNKKTKISVLKLTEAELQMLKDTANPGKSFVTASDHCRYTTYETLTAHTWRCACKARKLKPDQLTAVGICVDSRKRTNPPLPEAYFGNAVLDVKAVGHSGDIVSKPLAYSAEKVRKAVEKVDEEYLSSAIEFLKNEPDLTKFQDFCDGDGDKEPWFGYPNLEVTSWLRLPMYGLDFGFGKEIYFGTRYDFDGDTKLSQSGDGDGSVLVSICLSEDHMEDFEHYFYNDLSNVVKESRFDNLRSRF